MTCFINILYNALSICILIFITNNLKKNYCPSCGGILAWMPIGEGKIDLTPIDKKYYELVAQ